MNELTFEQTGTGGTGWLILIATVLVIIILVLFIWGIWWIKRRLTRPEMYGLSREEMRRRWDQVRKTSEQGLMGAKLAIMEADSLLDTGLKSIMMPGATLGERLKVACYKYQKLQNVWWAHKLRNQLVHEATFHVSQRQAKNALDEFEKALKIINVLD
ncbi:MAG: hypothetical protein ABIB04_04400 [Patescibacteria group bacterium]